MTATPKKEKWNSRLGVILAVAGSAVGLGNFLRFPGQAVTYGGDDGGGAFMVAYFISLIVIGIPICWAEWTMGRLGGRYGFNSTPGIFNAIVKRPAAKYIGVIGVIIPVIIYMYYVYIEAWCLGYAVGFLRGELSLEGDVAAYGDFWKRFIGFEEDGAALGFGWDRVGIYLALVFAFNFFLIYRGLSKGIEWFCKYAMPTLMVLALVILVRVLTLGAPVPDEPNQTVVNGLGYMWNPGNLVEKLKNPQLWLAAAGQIFFSLSVGFGVIITYASYLSKNDDVVLSGLTATSANEFCEVALGGLITIPAAYVFLGSAGIIGGGFALGFNVLPLVFSQMPAGQFFGFLFFFLLFLAAVTSSLSMLQPGIAFLEEALGIDRKASVGLLGALTAIGCAFVVYFSKDIKALETLDFWVGTFLIFVLGMIQIILFGWVLGIDKGFKEAHQGAQIRIPSIFKPIMKWICPGFLLIIFFAFVLNDVIGYKNVDGQMDFEPTSYVKDLIGSAEQEPNAVARMSVLLIILVTTFMLILVNQGGKRWAKRPVKPEEESI